MKRSIISALTTALVVGAASTTFAATNPFTDVPAGHWAYDAVTRLANEGIIEGYGDGTYRGSQNITRYEMAQMVAKAMAKTSSGSVNISRESQTDLNKLAAEFRPELNNLGVRVAELEKHSDFVKWTGEVRYRYWNDKTKDDSKDKKTNNQFQIRLFPTAEINSHWKAKARFTATTDLKADSTTDLRLNYLFAEGTYGKYTFNLGRMPLYTYVDSGMIADDFFSGLGVVGNFTDNFTGRLNLGRWRNTSFGATKDTTISSDYYGLEFLYDSKKRFNAGIGYHYFKSDDFKTVTNGSNKAQVLTVGAGYKINDDIKIDAAYAHNSKADNHKSAYNVEVNYKGANRSTPNSWGAFVAYRYVGSYVSMAPTYDSFGLRANKKGFEIGGTYTPAKNIWTKLSYFHGKTFDNDSTDKTWFFRTSFYF